MTAFLNETFPGSIAGVMTSWPGKVLSVRLARVLHASSFTSWRDVFENPNLFNNLRGTGDVLRTEVVELFREVELSFGKEKGLG